jgi:hypothetical protein
MSYMPILSDVSRSSQSSTDSDGYSFYMTEEHKKEFIKNASKTYIPETSSGQERAFYVQDAHELLTFMREFRWTYAQKRLFTYLSNLDLLPDMRSIARNNEIFREHRDQQGRNVKALYAVGTLTILLKYHKTFADRFHCFMFYFMHGIQPETAAKLTLATDVKMDGKKPVLISSGYKPDVQVWAEDIIKRAYTRKLHNEKYNYVDAFDGFAKNMADNESVFVHERYRFEAHCDFKSIFR